MSLSPPYLPLVFDDLQVAFPANAVDAMPAMADIPEDFHRGWGDARPWVEVQRRWFFQGLKGVTVTARDGIDKTAALRHLSLIQGSWEPKHEHKEAAVAYLMSLWFELIELPAVTR